MHHWQSIEGVTAIKAGQVSPRLKWSQAEIPAQHGKLAIVTGGSSGLGFETAIGLAQAGADVVLANRNESQGRWAAGRIRPLAPTSLVRYEYLDLANLASVSDFASRIERMERPVDLLVNNAGVMALPRRGVTADGFEMHLGTNYLGHYALTALLLPLLRKGMHPRVVQVSSISHRMGSMHWEDLQLERNYTPMRAYAQSKLALLLFTLELQRRSEQNGWGLMSVAAHPGYARTALFSTGPGRQSVLHRLHQSVGRMLSQSAASGALPILFAVTSVKARPGDYYGPKGVGELAGPSGRAGISSRAQDPETARRLWERSAELTGVAWPEEQEANGRSLLGAL